ncbi:hypothetical protein B0H10DRAFT_1985079 [Mycena sp. CBHHK59/15]|nr:hypothetical protein B0H10DRAFT_1985079 [Mycena sp. CBHHK59/15]
MCAFIPTVFCSQVIGGGPGGSYAATVLAREKIDVVLLEATRFPRYHVGESQLASLRHFLRFIDLEKEFEEFGFQRKSGAGYKLNQHKREGYTDFTAHDSANWSWNVVRSQSDEIMLRHASRSGVHVFEETMVTEIELKDMPDGACPIAATWKAKSGQTGRISFDFVIDASGRSGILSTKYFRTRKFNDILKNIASWGYWTGTNRYLPGTPRENSPFFEALTDESGWAWFIPLHDGTTSVGIVQNQCISLINKSEARFRGDDTSSLAHYQRELDFAPSIRALIGNAALIKKPDAPLVSSASDYSYSASRYAGHQYRIIGDAAGCSVSKALSGALSAAASICASIRGELPESEAARYHNKKVQASYTPFLLVVLSTYQQIRVQNVPILSNEDGFDHAFETTIEFLATRAFEPSDSPSEGRSSHPLDNIPAALSDEHVDDSISRAILKDLALRETMRMEDVTNINNDSMSVVEGFQLRLQLVGREKE